MFDTTATIEATQTRPGSMLRLMVGMMISATLPVVFLVMFWGRLVNHDTAWYLLATRDWLEGARLYVDLFEVNPPLNFYLTIPAVLLAQIFGIELANGQYLFTAGAIGACLFWIWTILSRDTTLGLCRPTALVTGVGAALILTAISDISQREHILVILLMPWLFELAGRKAYTVDGERIAPLVAAAIGICLKPFFLLFPVFITLWRIRNEGSLRPVLARSNIVPFSIGLFYVAYVRIMHPEYFTEVVPVARSVYGAIGAPAEHIAFRLGLSAAPFLLVLATGLAGRRMPAGTGLFLSATIAGLGCYLWQWAGFAYHLIPFEAFATVTCLWIVVHCRKISPVAIGGTITLAIVAAPAILRGPYDTAIVDRIADLIDPSSNPESVFVASTYVHAGPPLALALGARWASRYPHNWLAPGGLKVIDRTECKVNAEACAVFAAASNKNRDDNLADIEKEKPDVIVIDKRPRYIQDSDFSWYDFHAASPEWKGLRATYKLTASDELFDILTRCGATDPGSCLDFGNRQ